MKKDHNMNALKRWETKEMDVLQKHLARLFGLVPVSTFNGSQEPMSPAEWVPYVDISEDDKEWLIKVDLPEIKKEDINVTVQNGILTVAGERKFEAEEDGKTFHRIERFYGTFCRSFVLPEGVDGDKVTAVFKDSALGIHCPKNDRAKSKSIEVKLV
jgi:HSP20 family protein